MTDHDAVYFITGLAGVRKKRDVLAIFRHNFIYAHRSYCFYIIIITYNSFL